MKALWGFLLVFEILSLSGLVLDLIIPKTQRINLTTEELTWASLSLIIQILLLASALIGLVKNPTIKKAAYRTLSCCSFLWSLVLVALFIAAAVLQDVSRFPLFLRFATALSVPLNAPVLHCWLTVQGFNIFFVGFVTALSVKMDRQVAGEYRRLQEGEGEEESEVQLEQVGTAVGGEPGKPLKPWDSSDLLSNLYFGWVDEIVKLGSTRALELEDLVFLQGVDSAASAEAVFQESWRREREAAERKNRKPSVARAFMKTFFFDYMIVAGSMRLSRSALNIFSAVYLLPLLLANIQSRGGETPPNYLDGLLIALLLAFTNLLQLVINHQFAMRAIRMGLRMRSSYQTMVFSKSLKLRNNHLPIGEIVNMVSNDSSKFADLAIVTQNLWNSVVETIMVMSLLFMYMGVATIPGVVLVFSFFPFQGVVGKIISNIKAKSMVTIDHRIRLMNEILTAIKLIKLYAWESSFFKSISEGREKELRTLRKIANWKLINTVSGISVPIIAGGISFVTYSALGNTFQPTMAFATLSLFNMLRMSMSFFPAGVKGMATFFVSLQRLQDIIDLPELETIVQADTDIQGVVLKEASFKWDAAWARDTLHNITLTAPAGKTTALVGSIGAGKTSLLSAIMREMTLTSGVLEVKGSISFVPQQAWIVNATLKDNVTFGAPFDEERYRAAIEATSLQDDIKQLPGGDMTEIGERGVNLSGGQKQRVALARAVYNDSDIYLLDDPLGAVDNKVGRALFEKCIRGALIKKAVLLATHQLQYLKDVDHIIVMKEGRIVEEGTYQELVELRGELAQIMASQSGPEGGDDSQITRRRSTQGPGSGDGSSAKIPEQLHLQAQPSGQDVFKTMTAEERKKGAVSTSVYKQYMTQAGGMPVALSVILLYFLVQGVRIAIDTWFARWVQAETDNSDLGSEERRMYLSVYLGLIGLSVVILTGCGLLFFHATLTASTRIHNSVFKAVMSAPMSFFDTTPVGRIINRFSNDVHQIDDSLPETFDQTLYFGCQVVGTIVLVSVFFPYFLLVLIPLGYFYYKFQNFSRHSSRELKRLDGIARSPLNAHLSATLQGLPTIRAFGAQERFAQKNRDCLDISNSVNFTSTGANRWLGFRLDVLALVVVLFSALFSVFAPVSASVSGLVLSYVLQLTGQFQWCVRQYIETETKMTSVERLLQYSTLEPEGQHSDPNAAERERPAPPGWPRTGTVRFHNYDLRYRDELPLVLKRVSFEVGDKQKVGVVGRTGASKSTLATALFRIVEGANGQIFLDDVDIATIPLHDLRSKLTIIPQDPVLFIGTLRSNLDPTSSFTDEKIWRVLKQIHFHKTVSQLPGGLEFGVLENGENLSLGQRQLLCIARALLRESKVILMDEATASVDLETDQLIQRAMRESFQDCSVITIAHRINTIIDSDKVLVMDQGQVAEFDSPAVLLSRPESLFSKLIDETGAVSTFS